LADIGGVYLSRGEYTAAISYYRRALELARQLGDQLSVSKWLRNLCQSYSLLGNPALARGFEIEAEKLTSLLTEERKRAAQVAASLK
jgi:tetratricopeptide (TPR) repeat protein